MHILSLRLEETPDYPAFSHRRSSLWKVTMESRKRSISVVHRTRESDMRHFFRKTGEPESRSVNISFDEGQEASWQSRDFCKGIFIEAEEMDSGQVR